MCVCARRLHSRRRLRCQRIVRITCILALKCECVKRGVRTLATDLFTSLKANFKSISPFNHFLECITVSIIVKVSLVVLYFFFRSFIRPLQSARALVSPIHLLNRVCVRVGAVVWCQHLSTFRASYNSATLCEYSLLLFAAVYSSGSRGLHCGISLCHVADCVVRR